MNVSQLNGVLLDYWTIKCAGKLRMVIPGTIEAQLAGQSPSTNWAHGGPLIEKFDVGIDRIYRGNGFGAWIRSCHYENDDPDEQGETRLIAACRAIVASVYGHSIPDLAVT